MLDSPRCTRSGALPSLQLLSQHSFWVEKADALVDSTHPDVDSGALSDWNDADAMVYSPHPGVDSDALSAWNDADVDLCGGKGYQQNIVHERFLV